MNYRPIGVSNCLLARLILDAIQQPINTALPDTQAGSRKGYTTSQQAMNLLMLLPPPPPCLGTTLRKNRPLVPGSNSRTFFFYHGIEFFMVLVDARQLFRCAGQHFMCVATGPPTRGDPIIESQAHIPLKPLALAPDPFPEATSP